MKTLEQLRAEYEEKAQVLREQIDSIEFERLEIRRQKLQKLAKLDEQKLEINAAQERDEIRLTNKRNDYNIQLGAIHDAYSTILRKLAEPVEEGGEA